MLAKSHKKQHGLTLQEKPRWQKNLPIAVFHSTHAVHDVVVPPAGVLISVDKLHHAVAMTPAVADNLTLVLSVVERPSDRWRAGGTMTQVVAQRSASPPGIHEETSGRGLRVETRSADAA